jgi:RNA polymerase sigma-70 factor (ECF subfamily)
MQNLDDSELRDLLQRIAIKDGDALTKLYRHYEPFILGYIAKFQLDAYDSREAFDETFLVVRDKPHSFNFKSKFSTWLCGIARLKALDLLRRNRRSPPPESLPEDDDEEVPDLDTDTLAWLEKEEQLLVLKKCIDKLSLVQREAFYLIHVNGDSIVEVARVQACPTSTVKTRFHYSKRQIAACVEQHYRSQSR